MTLVARAGLVLALMAGAFSCAPSPPERAEADEVAQFMESFLTAFENLDWEAFRASFTEDASVFFHEPYPPQRISGRAAVEAEFEKVFRRWRVAGREPPYLEIEPRELRIQRYRDAAVVTFHLGDDARRGRRSFFLVRREGGWKIAHLHSSMRTFPGQVE